MSMPPNRDSAPTDDLSALSWVQDELRKTLEAAHKGLRRYLRDAAATAQSDLDDVEPTILRQARQQLHEGVGALQLVNVPEGALLLGASEALVQRYVAKPQKLELAGVEAVEHASFALLDYIGRRLAGKRAPAVGLFPQLKTLLELGGAERIHPADLWQLDWQWRDVSGPAVTPRQADAAMQAEFERRLLAVVKLNTPESAQALARDCAMLGAGAAAAGVGHEATLWRIAAAFFEAWGLGLLPQDLYVKRSASRVMAQLRARVRGDADMSERLAQDLLFYCAQAGAKVAAQSLPSAPWLGAVCATYRLGGEPVVDYTEARFGRHDPAQIQQARKRVNAAKEAWSGAASAEPQRLASLVETFTLLGDSTRRLYPRGGALSEALASVANRIAHSGIAPGDQLGMEVATSLLYLEAAIEEGEFDQPEQAERTQALAQRIERVQGGEPAQPLEPWMEELYRRVSDRQTLGSVVHELRVTLSEIERQIDLFFRSPSEGGLLAGVPSQLGSMRGVLSVLDVKPAEQAVLHMRGDIDHLLHGEADPHAPSTLAAFQRLAGNLGALGFLIDMLSVQPQMARTLFRFDAASGSLAPVMGRSQFAPDLVDRAQAIAHAVQRDGMSLQQVSDDLDALSREARAADQTELAASLDSAHAALEQAGEAGAGPGTEDAARQHVAQVMNDFVATATHPVGLDVLGPPLTSRPSAPSAVPAPSYAPTGLEDDDEMRAIFLEESREVLALAGAALVALAEVPTDLAQLTTVRRAFHTLKGSSRMVGLMSYGDAAWACEQLYNHWLAEQSPASADLRTFTGDALDYFSAWVDAIERRQPCGFVPEPLIAGADALRLAGELMRVPQPGQDEVETPRQSDLAPLSDMVDLEVPLDAFEAPAAPLFETLQATQPFMVAAAPSWEPTAPVRLGPSGQPEEAATTQIESIDLLLDMDSSSTEASVPQVPTEAAPPAEAPPKEASVFDPFESIDPYATGMVEQIEMNLPALHEPPDLELAEAAAEDVEDVEGAQDQVKVIGPLRLQIPLFNIYLNEADELSRRLNTELALWSLELERPLGETAVALAHSLAGSSGAVGFTALSGLARTLEHTLEQSHALGHGQPADAALFTEAADEIRRLLHQFAAGFLHEPPPDLAERLLAWQHTTQPLLAEVEPEVPDWAVSSVSATLPAVISEHATEPEPELMPVAEVITEPEASVFELPAFEPIFELPEFPEPVEAAPVPVPVPLPAPEHQDHIDAELFPIFEEEAEELLPLLSSQVEAWRAAPHDVGASAACMRSLHTFKGSARLAGAMRLGELAHQCESVMADLLADGDITPAGLDAVQQCVDALATLFDDLRRQNAAPSPSQLGLMSSPLSQMAAWATRPAPLDLDDMEPAPTPAPLDWSAYASEAASEAAPAIESTESAEWPPVESLSADLPAEPAFPLVPVVPVLPMAEPHAPVPGELPPIDWSRFVGEHPSAPAPQPDRAAISLQPVRVRAALLDRLVNLAGEVSVARARLDAEVGNIRGSLLDLNDNLDRLNRQLHDLTLQADSQLESRRQAARAAAQEFDPLELDRYTRLQELTRMMAESVNDVATVRATLQRTLQSAEDELAVQGRLTRELQGDLLRTRMIEFESLSERLHRVVRQAAKETGKQVRFDIVGGSIEVDRGVLDRMTAAFEHVLRNCITHGIETPEQRLLVDKDPTGSIVVSLEQEGNEVSVEIRDDGAGLDLPRIRAKAVDMGLIKPDAKVSDKQLAQYIFAPGLSTVSVVTELAGRGVGMDVVRNDVLAMGGRVETRTAPGRNTRIKLVLPLTTVVTQVVVLRAGGRSIAVPSNLVELVQRATPDALDAAYQEGLYDYGGLQLPFYWLGALLASSGRGLEAGRTLPVVIVRSAQQRVALHVDEVQGSHEVVVKNLGPQLSRLPGLAGMTLMAAGGVALIYNPIVLATVYGDAARGLMLRAAQTDAGQLEPQQEPVRPAPLVLVVDDSLTVRRVTKRLLEREGYRVALAKDGLEALEALAAERPGAVLSDIEMPRMDGFDLLRNIRGDHALAGLPVIMITSRIAQKHRDLALQLGANDYLGKPYDEQQLLTLLGQAMVLGAARS